jgi:hypothetical protein
MEGEAVGHNIERGLSSNFNCGFMAMSSLTYNPSFSVEFFFQPIYRLCKLGIF